MWKIRAYAALTVVVLSQFGSASALGATPVRDPSFGSGGMVQTDLSGNDLPADIAITRSGQIIVAGSSDDGSGSDFAVVRYLPDGSPDPTFSADGQVLTDLGGDDSAHSVAIQRDGKIVVIGDSWTPGNIRLAIVRYTPDGLLDPTFGEAGIVLTLFPGLYSFGTDVAIQRNGMIVVSGISIVDGEGERMAVARFAQDGSLDPTFGGGDGMTLLDQYMAESHESAVRRDGTILLSGNAGDSAEDFVVGGLTKTGQVLASFGVDGVAVTDLGGNDFSETLLVRRNGRLVSAGWTDAAGGVDIALVMLNARGRPVTSFGTDGTVITDLGGVDEARAIASTADGGILVAGNSDADGTVDFILVKYTATGSLDTSFGDGGVLRFDLGGDDGASGLIVSTRSTLLVGRTDAGDGYDFALLRLIRG